MKKEHTTQERVIKMRVMKWMKKIGVLAIVFGLFLGPVLPTLVLAAVNVYISNSAPASLQNDLIAGLTTQYQGTVTPGFFTNTYTVTISAKNPIVPCTGTAPCQLDLDIASMVAISSFTYPYGWSDGMRFERNHDLSYFTAPVGSIGMPNGGFFVNCSSATYFNGIQYSSMTSQAVSIDSATCNVVLAGVYNFIYQQYFSSPTVVPGF